MSSIMKGDRVKYIGISAYGAQFGESGIVYEVDQSGYFVTFSSRSHAYCYPRELELLQTWEDMQQPPSSGGKPFYPISGVYTLKQGETAEVPKSASEQKGAKKNDTAKPDLAYIPLVALEAEAGAFAVGGAKYGAFNYLEGGFTTRRLMAALIRHAYKYLAGEEVCPVDGQHHLGSVRATAAMILHCEQQGVLVDDRYKSSSKKVAGE